MIQSDLNSNIENISGNDLYVTNVSQMAAFQAKQDYGFDLGDQLAEKAVGQLSYEIDTEICNMLVENAAQDSDLVWSKTLPVGVNANSAFDVVIHLNHLVNC